jgi:heme-degrading monooxygenase HmoA
MVRHIVCWTLKPEAEGRSALEHAKIIQEKAMGLIGKVPGLLSMEVSYTVVSASDPVDLVLMTTHEDAAAYEAYSPHPEHVKVGDYVKKVVSGRYMVNYEV